MSKTFRILGDESVVFTVDGNYPVWYDETTNQWKPTYSKTEAEKEREFINRLHEVIVQNRNRS